MVMRENELDLDDASLTRLKEELLTRLRQEADQAWARRYV